MAVVIPTNKTRAVTATPVLDLNDIILNTTEIADSANEVAIECQEVERDRVDSPGSYLKGTKSLQ